MVVRPGPATRFQAALEVSGRASGLTRSNPVVNTNVQGKGYLEAILGPGSDWAKERGVCPSRSRYFVKGAHTAFTLSRYRRTSEHRYGANLVASEDIGLSRCHIHFPLREPSVLWADLTSDLIQELQGFPNLL